MARPLNRFQPTQRRSPLPRKYSQSPAYSTFRSLRFSSSPARRVALSAVRYPCGSFSELETVVLSDTTPCEALPVYRDFPADRHASAIYPRNKVGPPDFVENAPQNGALTTASIEKSALDVRPGCEGRLLENDDPAGRRQSISAARQRTSTGESWLRRSQRGGRRSRLADGPRTHSQPHLLILLDMMLPKLDGLGVLRALKHDPQTADIPVIVLSDLGQQNEAKLK